MSPEDQTKAFSEELGRLIDRYREEFDLTVIGCLQTESYNIYMQAYQEALDEEEDGEEDYWM